MWKKKNAKLGMIPVDGVLGAFPDLFPIPFEPFAQAASSNPTPYLLSEAAVSFMPTVPNTFLLAEQEFEPMVDWAALGTFLSIMLVFLTLIIRTNGVERAVLEREVALAEVRDLKSKALEGSSSGSNDSNEEQERLLKDALTRFEEAVEKEERLRNLVPGVVRIVPPSASTEADRTARQNAKQFLGKDYDIGSFYEDEVPTGQPATQLSQENGPGLPPAAIGVLAVLGVSLTGLLFFLSLDPMTSNSILDELDGLTR